MLKRNLWKLILSLAIVLWAVSSLLPIKDRKFDTYIASKAEAKRTEFTSLIKEASDGVAAKKYPSVYVALKSIANERKIDLTQYFPELKLEASLTNIQKRNDILLNYLLKKSQSPLQLGLDLKGGVAFTLQVDDSAFAKDGANVRTEKLQKAIEIIGNRINGLGVSEPLIRPIGDNRIEVQLAGVSTKDNPEVVDNLKKPARLEFCLVHPSLYPATTAPEDVPPGYRTLTLDQEGRNGQATTTELFVKRIPEATGEIISDAFPSMDQYGRFRIILKFTSAGSKRFADITRKIVENNQSSGRIGQLAIVLDGKLYSAPSVQKEIDGDSAEITGSFSQREAFDLSNVLNNPLDLPMQIKEQYEVGPSLAQDAIDSGVRATVIGTALVAAFMITFYSTGGVVAILTLAVNLLIILGTMASLGATLTLPGLAGIVLTIGMAVDANILIFERMREEIAVGKSLSTANESGYIKALMTILDAHFVQLIICGIMIGLGTGPIKGFGVTLAIGVISTLFSVLVTAHLVLEMLIEAAWVKKITMRRILKEIHVDFIKYGKAAFIGGWLLVLLGVAVVIYKGDKIYGIDFAGGDVVTVEFQQKLDSAEIRKIAQASGTGEVSATYASALGSDKEVLKLETAEGKSGELLKALQAAHPEAKLVSIGESRIGAAIGKEIELNALLAIGASMAVILVYIAFRFEFGFGVGAMFSSLHDILMTIGIFVLFGHQFSAPMVAAILCIAGYSINETVVVFDRIREELKLNPTGSLRVVVNAAINKVFARTIMTSTTTFLAALSLFLFGGGVLRDISFTFLVGIVTSTFSAIFISSQVFYWWHKGDRKHVEAHQDLKPAYSWEAGSKASQ
ncbi:MAG TPA: protein translocase subunit SecD [Rariglobus sp.]|nr:protein translocase subunit SecD [Rariglobus sp.]